MQRKPTCLMLKHLQSHHQGYVFYLVTDAAAETPAFYASAIGQYLNADKTKDTSDDLVFPALCNYFCVRAG
jgi:hypothetical protein